MCEDPLCTSVTSSSPAWAPTPLGAVSAGELAQAASRALGPSIEALLRSLDDAQSLAAIAARDAGPLEDRVRAARWAAARLDRIARTLNAAVGFRERSLVPTRLSDVLVDAASSVQAATTRSGGVTCSYAVARPVLADPTRLLTTLTRLLFVAIDYVADAATRPIEARVLDDEGGCSIEIVARRDDDRAPPRSAVAELEVVLCRHVVALHAGHLAIQPRAGTLTMTLTLPAYEAAATSERPTSRPRGRES